MPGSLTGIPNARTEQSQRPDEGVGRAFATAPHGLTSAFLGCSFFMLVLEDAQEAD